MSFIGETSVSCATLQKMEIDDGDDDNNDKTLAHVYTGVQYCNENIQENESCWQLVANRIAMKNTECDMFLQRARIELSCMHQHLEHGNVESVLAMLRQSTIRHECKQYVGSMGKQQTKSILQLYGLIIRRTQSILHFARVLQQSNSMHHDNK